MIGVFELGMKQATLSKASPMILQVHKRFKKGKAPRVTNTKRALEYFDVAYPPIYGSRWPSIRLALLSKSKYISVVNNFANYDKTIEKFQELGAMDIRPRYTAMLERVKARKNKEDNQSPSQLENESSQQDENETPVKIRPSLIELDDDELAARAVAKDISRYPEEYRQRALAQNESLGDVQLDLTNRVIQASHASVEEVLMMDYVPSTKLKGLEHWIEESDVFLEASQGDQDIGLKIEVQEEPIELPHMLKIYSFLKGDISHFPHPRNDGVVGVQDHFPLDGASLLPVLALDLKLGERMLDLCAAPGGKSFIALQTLLLEHLVCNDISPSRVRRILNIMKQYVPTGLSSIKDMIAVTMENGCMLPEREAYDKVLVDVPCINDRHSLEEDDNSIFTPRRTKERLRLPEIQSQLLVSALQAVRPGGTVVYSTCTLSPLQNDGVVHLALSRIWQETTIECSVVDMSYAVQPLSFLYRFGSNLGLRYGQIVLPSLLNNFGPMYIAKIKRIR